MRKPKKLTISERSVLVITRPQPSASKPRSAASGDRFDVGSVVKSSGKAVLYYMQVDPEVLQAELSVFLGKMSTVVQTLPAVLGHYSLDTVTLSVEITAKGKVGLLGSGGELGGRGGLTFTLKRRSTV